MGLTVQSLLAQATSALLAHGIESARLDSSVLLCHLLNKEPHFPLLEPDYPITVPIMEAFDLLVRRRCKKEPVAYITGKKEFWSLDFVVTYDTLIPRPDSETIVQAVLDKAKTFSLLENTPCLRLVDIGTGTGCILIAILCELPFAKGTAIDINSRTLEVAKHNAKMHGFSSRINFIQSNWLEAVKGKFDIIISNPPYITQPDFEMLMEDVKEYEPRIALVSGEDGMDSYRFIASQALDKLSDNGLVVLEVGSTQANKVAEIFCNHGFFLEEVRNDMAGKARCVIVRKAAYSNSE